MLRIKITPTMKTKAIYFRFFSQTFTLSLDEDSTKLSSKNVSNIIFHNVFREKFKIGNILSVLSVLKNVHGFHFGRGIYFNMFCTTLNAERRKPLACIVRHA